MAALNMDIPHQLSQEEALTRVKKLLVTLQDEQKDRISNVKEEWNGDTGNFQFTASGFDLSGQIKVQPNSITIDSKLPLALTFFKGMIKDMIEKKTTELLS
jgi:putative polyhydroxyalkanoate system protein